MHWLEKVPSFIFVLIEKATSSPSIVLHECDYSNKLLYMLLETFIRFREQF